MLYVHVSIDIVQDIYTSNTHAQYVFISVFCAFLHMTCNTIYDTRCSRLFGFFSTKIEKNVRTYDTYLILLVLAARIEVHVVYLIPTWYQVINIFIIRYV